jgi:hypothetical protein
MYNQKYARSLSKGQITNTENNAALKGSNKITIDEQCKWIVHSKSTKVEERDLECFMLTLDILTEHPAVPSVFPGKQDLNLATTNSLLVTYNTPLTIILQFDAIQV